MLELRTKDFSVAVFKLLDALPKRVSTQVVAFQLGKSASSIGANYREATRAESRADFSHKLQIALKESAESCYWLEILCDLYPMHKSFRKLSDDCVEIRNLFQTIVKSARCKMTAKPQNSQLSTHKLQIPNP